MELKPDKAQRDLRVLARCQATAREFLGSGAGITEAEKMDLDGDS